MKLVEKTTKDEKISVSPRINNYGPIGRVETHKITICSPFFLFHSVQSHKKRDLIMPLSIQIIRCV